jgi:hypothetical protein
MKTIVLPVCEKCGKPIEPEACILVDGALFRIARASAACVYKVTDQPLVEHYVESGAYHTGCLVKIINEYALKGSLQKLDAAIKKLDKTVGNIFDGVDEAKPGAKKTVVQTVTAVPKKSWSWYDVSCMRSIGIE